MFVLNERNIVISASNDSASVRLRAGMMETISGWAAETDHFQALARDGKTVSFGISDREGQRAAEKKVRTRWGTEITEEQETGAMFYWGQPQFRDIRAAAADLGNSTENYTAEQFQEDFPQFFTELGESLLPRTMSDESIRQVNAAIQPDKWLGGQRYAAGLYTTHYATLYLKTYTPSGEMPGQAAATRALMGMAASIKLGQDSVTYDTDAPMKATEG